jgi:predicted DNA-binding protein with PD1-like motif
VQFLSTDFGFLLTLQPGDELIRCLIQFARAQEVDAAVITGSGSVSEADLGSAGDRERDRRRTTITEPLEACSLTGTLTLVDGEPFPHLHGTFARNDHSLIGGHVFQAVCLHHVELALQLAGHALAHSSSTSPFGTGRTS